MKKSSGQSHLLAVIFLLLTPIVLLGSLLFLQGTKDIAFAVKERLGLDYLRGGVEILIDLSLPTPKFDPEKLSELRRLATVHDENMVSSQESADLLDILSRPAPDVTDAIAATRNLITRIGDQSNLILDPDLDSYYLMDQTLLKLPELITIASTLGSTLDNIADPNHLTADEWTNIILGSGQIFESREGISQSFKLAFSGNTDGSVRANLGSYSVDFGSLVTGFGVNVRSTSFTPAEAKRRGIEQVDMRVEQGRLIAATRDIWIRSATELDRLLSDRIQRLQFRLYMALGISGLIALVALSISVRIFRSTIVALDEKIVFLAHHDPLTKLRNRATFAEELDQALSSDGGKGCFAVHYIDLDRFKAINDTQGHGAGDSVIKMMAERLVGVAGPDDFVARLGGDEFVVLQRGVTRDEDAADFAHRIVLAMRHPFVCDRATVRSTASVGTAIAPRHGQSSAELMRNADMSLYASKRAGKDRYTIFNDDIQAAILERTRIEDRIRAALDQNLFFLNFQPQFNAAGTQLRCFEALLRLRDEDGELIPPTIFIPIAEKLGLISLIGAWVIGRACATAATWAGDINVAINLSPLQFADGFVADVIAAALQETKLPAHRLEVEITEGILLDDTEAVLSELQRIRALGVSIAMDDFGIGYSSLAYLLKFPFNKIKIDRSFMPAVETGDVMAANILRTIVTLGHSMEMTVTAEGVETDRQAEILQQLDCDQVQGYLYGRPVGDGDVAGLISRYGGAAPAPHRDSRLRYG